MNNDLRPINTIPNFKRFCMTIGELPTSYLETMSYYEMLVWFTEYMKNTIIPTINNNGLAIEELQNKYNELKSYVDNYFTNLDVQQEINNKLDAMAESGQLTDIIAQYLGLAGLLVFNNVQEMKEAKNLVNNSSVMTYGFYNFNDGGSAKYKIRNVTNEDTIDDITIIRLNNPLLIAELIIEKTMSPEQFGAKGDGINDDTLNLNKMFSINTNYICNNIYLYNNGLTINHSLYGNGKFIKNIQSDRPIIISGNNITIENITFDGNNKIGRLVEVINGKNITFLNCIFKNVGSLEDEYANACLFTRTNAENINILNCKFIRCYAKNISTLYWNEGGKYINISNCYFEDVQPRNDGDGIKTLGGEAYINVENCYFKNCSKRAMKFQSKYCYSKNNYIYNLNSTEYPIDFQRGYGSSINDTIEIEWDGTTTLPSTGFVYNFISICKGYVNVENLNTKIILPVNTEFPASQISYSRGIVINSLLEDDKDVKNITLKNINIEGSNNAIYVGDNITSIDNLIIKNFTFNNKFTGNYACMFKSKPITNLNIDEFNITGNNVNSILWDTNNVTNSYIKINSNSTKMIGNIFYNTGNRYELSGGNTITNHIIRNGKTICFLTNNDSPNESTFSSYNELKYQPAGTIALMNNPVVDSIDNTKMRIGYISTSDGTGSSTGKYLPIYVQITPPSN